MARLPVLPPARFKRASCPPPRISLSASPPTPTELDVELELAGEDKGCCEEDWAEAEVGAGAGAAAGLWVAGVSVGLGCWAEAEAEAEGVKVESWCVNLGGSAVSDMQHYKLLVLSGLPTNAGRQPTWLGLPAHSPLADRLGHISAPALGPSRESRSPARAARDRHWRPAPGAAPKAQTPQSLTRPTPIHVHMVTTMPMSSQPQPPPPTTPAHARTSAGPPWPPRLPAKGPAAPRPPPGRTFFSVGFEISLFPRA